MNKATKWILWAVLLTILAVYPKVFGIYYSNVFVTFAIFALFAVTLNLLLGYTGLLSFGHAMFFGTGGYGTAIALEHIEGLPLLPAVLIGVLAAVALALILCPIVVRVSGTAFAMLHLAFGQLMYVLALKRYHRWRGWCRWISHTVFYHPGYRIHRYDGSIEFLLFCRNRSGFEHIVFMVFHQNTTGQRDGQRA
jgi:branched-subunit amino acid ABC-type transport system permease component